MSKSKSKIKAGFRFIGRPGKGITDLHTGEHLSQKEAVERMVAEIESRQADRNKEYLSNNSRNSPDVI